MTAWDGQAWRIAHIPVPQQTNGHDCGVFTAYFAKCTVLGCPIVERQQFMPYFRSYILRELLAGVPHPTRTVSPDGKSVTATSLNLVINEQYYYSFFK